MIIPFKGSKNTKLANENCEVCINYRTVKMLEQLPGGTRIHFIDDTHFDTASSLEDCKKRMELQLR